MAPAAARGMNSSADHPFVPPHSAHLGRALGVLGGLKHSLGPVVHDVASPVVHDVASPVAHDVASPVVHDVASPVAHDVASPVVHDIASPVVHDIASPVVHDIASPLVHDIASPLIHDIASPVEHVVSQIVEHITLSLDHLGGKSPGGPPDTTSHTHGPFPPSNPTTVPPTATSSPAQPTPPPTPGTNPPTTNSSPTNPPVANPSLTTNPPVANPSLTTNPPVANPSPTTNSPVAEPSLTTNPPVANPSPTTNSPVAEPSPTIDSSTANPSPTTNSPVAEPSPTIDSSAANPSPTTNYSAANVVTPTPAVNPSPTENAPIADPSLAVGASSEASDSSSGLVEVPEQQHPTNTSPTNNGPTTPPAVLPMISSTPLHNAALLDPMTEPIFGQYNRPLASNGLIPTSGQSQGALKDKEPVITQSYGVSVPPSSAVTPTAIDPGGKTGENTPGREFRRQAILGTVLGILVLILAVILLFILRRRGGRFMRGLARFRPRRGLPVNPWQMLDENAPTPRSRSPVSSLTDSSEGLMSERARDPVSSPAGGTHSTETSGGQGASRPHDRLIVSRHASWGSTGTNSTIDMAQHSEESRLTRSSWTTESGLSTTSSASTTLAFAQPANSQAVPASTNMSTNGASPRQGLHITSTGHYSPNSLNDSPPEQIFQAPRFIDFFKTGVSRQRSQWASPSLATIYSADEAGGSEKNVW